MEFSVQAASIDQIIAGLRDAGQIAYQQSVKDLALQFDSAARALPNYDKVSRDLGFHGILQRAVINDRGNKAIAFFNSNGSDTPAQGILDELLGKLVWTFDEKRYLADFQGVASVGPPTTPVAFFAEWQNFTILLLGYKIAHERRANW